MNFAEELLKLNEEEIFGKQKLIDIKESDIMKNLGTLENMLLDAMSCLKERDVLLYEDAQQISISQFEAMEKMGEVLEKIKKYK